jgi:hypothetical protein
MLRIFRSHVKFDLHPYVCIVEKCTAPIELFATSKEWLSHMRKSHFTQWSCGISTHTTPIQFQSEEGFIGHMKAAHPERFREEDLSFIARRSSHTQNRIFEACPFCGIIGNEPEVHVAEHLRELALLSWPPINPAEDGGSSCDPYDSEEDSDDTAFRSIDIDSGASEPFLEEIPNEHDENQVIPGSAQLEYEFMGQHWGLVRNTPAAIRLPYFVVPYDQNHRFYGRMDVLSKIWDILKPHPPSIHASYMGGLRSFTLSGPGGMGKTQVATQFVHEHRLEFDAIFWVHAGEIDKLHYSFGQIATALGLVVPESVEALDKALLRDLVLNWLAEPRMPNKERDDGQIVQISWLLVFDGADIPQLLNDFWPRTATGSVLITSRDPFDSSSDLERSGTSLLAPFDISETAEFILEFTHREDNEEDRKLVTAVAKLIGGVPLAAVQIAGSLLRRNMTFAEFLQEYDDPRSHKELFRQPCNGVYSG